MLTNHLLLRAGASSRYTGPLLCTVLAVFLGASTSIAQNAAQNAQPTIADVVALQQKAIVMIVTFDKTGSTVGQGSGVFITGDGAILTNAHVLEDAYSAEVQTDAGKFDLVTVVAHDTERDLALIHVDARSVDFGTLASEADYRPGDRVIAIGNPLGLEKSVSDGLISGIRRKEDGLELIQTTVPISPGSSGGVLLNSIGEVIGITTASFEGGQNVNFAVGLRTIENFLSDVTNKNARIIKNTKLETARKKLWHRVLLGWIGGIIAGILTIVFGGGYLVWVFIVIGFYVLYGIYRAVRWLVGYPFRLRNRRREQAEARASTQEAAFREHGGSDAQQQSLKLDYENQEANGDDSDELVIYCWKCGSPLSANVSEEEDDQVECGECHTVSSVPREARPAGSGHLGGMRIVNAMSPGMRELAQFHLGLTCVYGALTEDYPWSTHDETLKRVLIYYIFSDEPDTASQAKYLTENRREVEQFAFEELDKSEDLIRIVAQSLIVKARFCTNFGKMSQTADIMGGAIWARYNSRYAPCESAEEFVAVVRWFLEKYSPSLKLALEKFLNDLAEYWSITNLIEGEFLNQSARVRAN